MSPVVFCDPAKYQNYELNADVPTANRCIQMLQDAGFNAHPNPKFDWIHDTYMILIRMFPNGCPPTTIVSMNARYDPHFHVKIGASLRPLRKEGYVLIGSGGGVHNLYRNRWTQMLRYRDNFAQETPPEDWALDFRQAVEDVMTKTSGPGLRRGVTRLMKHPLYREAQATDDHFMPALFVAGAAGDKEDEGVNGKLGAETWELVSRSATTTSNAAHSDQRRSRQTCATPNSRSESGLQPRDQLRVEQRNKLRRIVNLSGQYLFPILPAQNNQERIQEVHTVAMETTSVSPTHNHSNIQTHPQNSVPFPSNMSSSSVQSTVAHSLAPNSPPPANPPARPISTSPRCPEIVSGSPT